MLNLFFSSFLSIDLVLVQGQMITPIRAEITPPSNVRGNHNAKDKKDDGMGSKDHYSSSLPSSSAPLSKSGEHETISKQRSVRSA